MRSLQKNEKKKKKNQTKLTSKCNFWYNSLGLAKKNHRNNIEILTLNKM